MRRMYAAHPSNLRGEEKWDQQQKKVPRQDLRCKTNTKKYFKKKSLADRMKSVPSFSHLAATEIFTMTSMGISPELMLRPGRSLGWTQSLQGLLKDWLSSMWLLHLDTNSHLPLVRAQPQQVRHEANKDPLRWDQQRRVLWGSAETADFAGGCRTARPTVL